MGHNRGKVAEILPLAKDKKKDERQFNDNNKMWFFCHGLNDFKTSTKNILQLGQTKSLYEQMPNFYEWVKYTT